jgi:hypothetical protein
LPGRPAITAGLAPERAEAALLQALADGLAVGGGLGGSVDGRNPFAAGWRDGPTTTIPNVGMQGTRLLVTVPHDMAAWASGAQTIMEMRTMQVILRTMELAMTLFLLLKKCVSHIFK